MSLRHRPHRILYVPADERPCSLQWPRLVSRMVDWDLVTPPANMLGWFNQHGEPEEVAAWALEAAKQPLDGAVLSLDMLAYGGMRAAANPGTRTALAQRRLEVLTPLREAIGSAPIFAFASILGLTATTHSDEAARYVRALREYSVLVSQARSGAGAAKEALQELEAAIPPAVIGEYIAIRGRNHEINRRVVDETGRGHIDFLVLAQDEAAPEGMHREEQADLRAAADRLDIGDRAVICDGGAELGMLLIARLIHGHMNKVPRVRPAYSNEDAADRIAPGEDRTVREGIVLMTSIMGGRVVDEGEEEDLTVVVNCPIAAARETVSQEPYRKQRRAELARLVEDARVNRANRHLAVFDTALPDGADEALVDVLLSAVADLPTTLTAYGWGRPGRVLASGLAHAALRLIALQDKGAFDLAQLIADLTPMRYLGLLDALIESEKAHVALLFTRFVEDYLYHAKTRPQVEEHVTGLIKDSIVDLREVHERAERLMSDLLGAEAADLWIEHFLGRTSVKVGMEPHRSALVLAEIEETRLTFPWRRLAEVEVDVHFGVELVAE